MKLSEVAAKWRDLPKKDKRRIWLHLSSMACDLQKLSVPIQFHGKLNILPKYSMLMIEAILQLQRFVSRCYFFLEPM
jgi:hypothetical protein